jgi:uncharacterized protein (TIGR03083 family)
MDYSWHCDELEAEGSRFLDLARAADPSAAVPTCPGWSVSDLLVHVGFFHRFAENLVRRRAVERLGASAMGVHKGPPDPDYLAEGLSLLLATLRASDPDDPMWAWGADQHVRFWARRMLHETLIHHVDLAGASGASTTIAPDVARDGVDELLVNLASAAAFSPSMANLVGDDETLAFRSREGDEWAVRLSGDGFALVPPVAAPDALLTGPLEDLLLVVYRRRDLAASSCAASGREDLVTRWLENSALL